jgi:hypothetical protein
LFPFASKLLILNKASVKLIVYIQVLAVLARLSLLVILVAFLGLISLAFAFPLLV